MFRGGLKIPEQMCVLFMHWQSVMIIVVRGWELVNQIISDAKESGSEAIHLDVIDNNVAAEAFYKGLGFQYIGTENIFYEVVGHRNFKMYEYILRE